MIYIALIARITRASMLEVLDEEYIRTARSKGVKERVVLLSHALRNAAVPIATVIGIGIALLIGGVVVAYGAAREIFNNPQQDYTKALFDAALGRSWDFGVLRAK